MTEQHDSRFEFEERDGRRLKLFAGQAGKYVGVTERKGKFKTSFYARACVTKRKGDKRRQYAINGCFASAVAAAIAIADAEALQLAQTLLRATGSLAHVRCLPPATCPEFHTSDTLLPSLSRTWQPKRVSTGSAPT